MVTRALLAALLLASACGGDDGGGAPPPRPAAQPNAKGGKKPGNKKEDKNKLQARVHAEDRVFCVGPEKPTGTECKPEAATCDPGRYCVPDLLPANAPAGTAPKFSCEPCPERDSIRHEFKDRDFIAEQSRDPFQSFVIVRTDLGKPVASNEKPTGPCTRPDQFRATSFSYQDLKLVGLVGTGTKKTALMMNSRNVGEFIRRGDCVGKEKALVADIVMHDETACLTFQVTPAQPDKGPPQPAREQTVCLYPNGLPIVESQPTTDDAPTGPQVAPPPGSPQVAPPPIR